jgi:hypothetical protein
MGCAKQRDRTGQRCRRIQARASAVTGGSTVGTVSEGGTTDSFAILTFAIGAKKIDATTIATTLVTAIQAQERISST